MSIGALISENLELILAGGGATIAYFSHHVVAKFRQGPKAIEPVLIEGRTHDEWYDLIKSMGKETFERVALGPLDGLERSQEHGWDYKRLLGDRWKMLERQWYPERYPKEIEADHNTFNTGKIMVTANGVIYNNQFAHISNGAINSSKNRSLQGKLDEIEEYISAVDNYVASVTRVPPSLLSISQVRYLQSKMGLRPDGIIGPHTRYELNLLMRIDPGLVRSLRDYRG